MYYNGKITKHKCDALYGGSDNVNDVAAIVVGHQGTRRV